MSRCLSERSIDHVMLERGEVANSWRTERWDSQAADAELAEPPSWLQLRGDDPDGYRTLAEVIEFIARYAKAISAPVRAHTAVTSVRPSEADYLVRTEHGDWRCRTIVVASGAWNIADVSVSADRVPPSMATDPSGVSSSGTARRRWRLGRRCIRDRYSHRR